MCFNDNILTDTERKHIEHIITHFDWVRVHKAMKALNWTWAGASTESGVPSVGELVVAATRLMTNAFNCGYDRIATGGLSVHHAKETGFISLSFEIDEWSNMDLIEN